MSEKRDEFSPGIKELLAKRVGLKCSNPNCRKTTCGANEDSQKFTNIGVAAHITAAGEGGPRYDESITSEERKSYSNGIWLCQSCSKLIDSDKIRYTKELLLSWKGIAEKLAILELEMISPVLTNEKDKEVIKFFVQCFDRSAFQDDICSEGRMEDFDKAIEDTIIALNTGILRTRDGDIIKKSEGKAVIQNPVWREKLDIITDMLVTIRRRLKIAKDEKAYIICDRGSDSVYSFYDQELCEWFNLTREEIIKILSSICKEIGIQELKFSRRKYRL